MWADKYIEELKAGRTVKFRPVGNSMSGLIESGQLVTVEPGEKYYIGDIVLCVVDNKQYLHLIKNTRSGKNFLIGNNKGGINGWIDQSKIYGRCIDVED